MLSAKLKTKQEQRKQPIRQRLFEVDALRIRLDTGSYHPHGPTMNCPLIINVQVELNGNKHTFIDFIPLTN